MSKVHFVRTAFEEGLVPSPTCEARLHPISNGGASLASGVALKNPSDAQ